MAINARPIIICGFSVWLLWLLWPGRAAWPRCRGTNLVPRYPVDLIYWHRFWPLWVKPASTENAKDQGRQPHGKQQAKQQRNKQFGAVPHAKTQAAAMHTSAST